MARIENLDETTSAQEFPIGKITLPATLWVRPTSGNTFTVTYSTDDGANFQSLSALTGAAAYTETQVSSGFTHIKITPSGTQGGTWGIC